MKSEHSFGVYKGIAERVQHRDDLSEDWGEYQFRWWEISIIEIRKAA